MRKQTHSPKPSRARRRPKAAPPRAPDAFDLDAAAATTGIAPDRLAAILAGVKGAGPEGPPPSAPALLARMSLRHEPTPKELRDRMTRTWYVLRDVLLPLQVAIMLMEPPNAKDLD
jgi:hypothetical protein